MTNTSDYLLTFFTTLVLGLVFFRPWSYSKRFIFTGADDWIWQQSIFQMHGSLGLFGITKHLAWPLGSDPWRLPQLGMLIGAWARVTVGWLSMGTATSILIYLSVIAAVNSLAMVFFIRGLVGAKFRTLTIVVSVMLSASEFTFLRQLNLSSFFVVPLSFGILCRFESFNRKQRLKWVSVLAIAAIISPLWWVVVLVLMLPFVLLSHILRRHWSMSIEALLIWCCVLIGLFTQIVIFVIASRGGPGADLNRQPWQSNVIHGFFSGLFVGSTFIGKIAPSFVRRIGEGSGWDLNYGIPINFTAFVSLLSLLVLPPIRTRSGINLGHLRPLTLIAVLYWLGGGLGNLQAALAVTFGTVSPARAWSRMVLILAILGSGWILAGLKHYTETSQKFGRPRTRTFVAVLLFLLIVGGLGDLKYDPRLTYSRPSTQQTTTPAVDFIVKKRQPCRVAQFPNEAFPNIRIATGVYDPRTYRGLIPYILEPTFTWTSGSYDPKNLKGIANYPQIIKDDDFRELEKQGYCAVLFDKELSQSAIDQNITIEGREISATRIVDYEDPMYQVFLLNIS